MYDDPKSAGRVFRILFTAQDGTATKIFAEIIPIPTNKLSVGNLAKFPARKEAKKKFL